MTRLAGSIAIRYWFTTHKNNYYVVYKVNILSVWVPEAINLIVIKLWWVVVRTPGKVSEGLGQGGESEREMRNVCSILEPFLVWNLKWSLKKTRLIFMSPLNDCFLKKKCVGNKISFTNCLNKFCYIFTCYWDKFYFIKLRCYGC